MARGNSSFSQVTVCESMEFVADDDLQEEEEEEGNDNNIGERCGICMDIVIDRGVLDCCQHWFCFSCIDNWATITNLCPLCQNEFQLITCVPVYDTIGSNNVDEDLQLRDDDWRIEGKNNTLSFPSYYIDENAVVCLEGDGCKVRSMSASIEEYSNLDTSIACDSCDIWYHAFCVGFDAEGTCENSWLCPRCTVTIMQQKSYEVLLPMPSNQNVSENSGGECLVDAALAGKVVVSVADAGETAVVVSMLEEKQGTEEENQAIMSHLEVHNDPKFGSVETLLVKENEEIKLSMLEAPCQMSDPVDDALGKSASEVSEGTEEERRKFLSFRLPEDLKMDPSLPSSFPNNHNLENDRLSIEPNSVAEELQLSLSQGSSIVLPTNSLFSKSETISVDKEISTASLSIAFETSSSQLLDQLHNKEALVSGMDLHLGLSVSSSLSVHKTKLTEDQVQQINNLKESLLLADDAVVDRKNNDDVICGTKRKTRDWRGAEDGKPEVKVAGKKVTDKGNTEMLHLRGQADESVSKAKQKTSGPIAVLKNGKGDKSGQIKVTTSIMDIVHGTENRRKRLAHPNLAGTSSGNRETAAGLRVKKIMRRPTEENESFVLVQKLRKEIRDAVRNKTSKELGGNNFDPKLLAAFRAAVVGPESESKKSLPVDLMAKKSLLRKGNVRENLTKKIYGMGGRRRRAWNRDCEIEFWKYRCSKISKPEKIETLKSVLNLLRKDPESTEIKQRNENDASSSILSRLYVADSSLFPRKEDIKPLSTLKGDSDTGQNKVVKSTEKTSTSALGNNSSRTPATSRIPSQIKIPPINSAGNKQTVPVLKGGFPSSKLHSDTCSEGTSLSTLGASNSLKETNGKSDDIRTDKRKWAQQFLARKAAVAGKDTSKEQEDIGVLKVNHPLLAQLPRDMRPILAISRHNKLPTSVRQAQLYRLTEHFLRKANIPVHSRTAEIELAVADAVNIEKMVADKSNSKLVYVNLCSQELLHRSGNTSSGGAVEANPNLTSEIPTDRSVKETNDSSSSFEVVEALRNAGLLSDSPPNSPHHRLEEIEEDDNSTELVQEGPDNVFEIDSQPELDIYGDFEYDLEDEDFIGASSLKTSELQPGEPKLKMVFSTADTDRSSGAQTSEDREDPVEPDGSFNSLENLTNTITASSNNDSKKDKFDPQSSSVDDGGEEFSLAECEELYGPDREPMVTKFPESTYTGPYESIPTNLVSQNNEDNGYIHTLEASNVDKETSVQNLAFPTVVHQATVRGDELNRSQKSISGKEKIRKMDSGKQHDDCSSVYRKVEAYIKEHIRPLCKSGVINVEQYRWAVAKTANKIMKYHSKDKNANFLIKEGEKVKKLAEQYVEAAPRT